MNNRLEIVERRKVHDIWAALLYLITAGILNTVILSTLNISKSDDLNKQDWTILIKLGIGNSVMILLDILITMIACIYIPKVLIYSSFAALPIVYILTAVFFNPGIGSLISLGITLVLFVIILFFIYKHIDFAAKMISAASSILLPYMLPIIAIFLFTNALMILQVIIITSANEENDFVRVFQIIGILVIFWSIAIANYFYQVFISSIVVMHVTKGIQNISVVAESIKNTLYAIGSICLGALLLAIVQTLRYMLKNNREQIRREGRRPNLALIILQAIIGFILSLLETIISHANRLAYPYLAIHGTSYKDSIVESFEIITRSDFKNLATFIAIDLVLALLFLVSAGISLVLNIFVFTKYNTETDMMYGMAAIFSGLYIYISILMMISSGALALIYINISAPNILAKYDLTLSEAIKKKNQQLLQ